MALSIKSFAITPESSTTPTECELFQANPASFVFTLPTGQTFNGADVVRLELRAASTPGDTGLLARVSSSASPTGASVTLAFTSAQMNQSVTKTVTDYALILYATEGDTHRTLWIGTLKLNADDSTASLTADPPEVTNIYLTSEAVAAVYATIATVDAIDDRVTALESGGASEAVLYTAQSLDAGQKEQAATNIGLGVDDDVTHNSLTIFGGVNVGDELTDLAGSISTNTSAIGSLSTAKMDKSSNLSDLASAATARTNLGLGTLATQSGTAPSGTIVGTTDTQTLTNKSISATQLTGDIAVARIATALTTPGAIGSVTRSAGNFTRLEATNELIGSDCQISGGGFFSWSGSSILKSPLNGVITLWNNSGSGFDKLQFGGTTASFGSIATNGTTLEFKLADGSAFSNAKGAVIEASIAFKTPSFTVGTVPSAATYAQGVIYVSNESGGAVIAFSDGTDWRRVTDRAIIS